MGGSSNKKSGLQLTPRQLLLISFPGSGESDDWMNKVHRLALDQLFYLSARKENPEMEFLDINVTKDLNLLLHDFYSTFYRQILKKTKLFTGFQDPYKKSAKQETRVCS